MSLNQIRTAFDYAVDRCEKSYPVYFIRNDMGFGDEFFDIMRRGRSDREDLLDKFIMVNHGFAEDKSETLPGAMACLSLYLHPEYLDQYPADMVMKNKPCKWE